MAGPFVGNIFLGTPDAGWTLNVYPDGVDYETSMEALQAINDATMALLPSGVRCINLRVSDMTQKRDVLSAAPKTPAGSFLGTGGPANPTDPNLALVQKFLAGPFHWFNLFLRGLPSQYVDVTDPASFKYVQAEWGSGYQAWLDAIKTNAQFVQKKAGPPPVFTGFTITDYVKHPASTVIPLSVRKAGRPFGLRRGRERT